MGEKSKDTTPEVRRIDLKDEIKPDDSSSQQLGFVQHKNETIKDEGSDIDDGLSASDFSKPKFFVWLFIVLPGLLVKARFGGLGTFRGMTGAILTVMFTISLFKILRSESALPERLPIAIAILASLIVLSVLLIVWGYKAFCSSVAKLSAGERPEDKTEGEAGNGHQMP